MSLELYSIQNGSLTDMQYVYGSYGIIESICWRMGRGPDFILMVDNDQLRRAISGFRGFLGRE